MLIGELLKKKPKLFAGRSIEPYERVVKNEYARLGKQSYS